MAAPLYNPQIQTAYQRLFDTCIINPNKYPLVNPLVKIIVSNRGRYETVGNQLNIPWYFIGIVHCMECNSKFNLHLHNGDPLTARTVNVPAGRPKTGVPPFPWEASALDALVYQKMNLWTDWSLPGILYKLEGYNGYGYERLTVPINTPYLWSFSNHYTSGKFVKDGIYSPTAVSRQCGAAILLRRLVETQTVVFAQSNRPSMIKQIGDLVTYAPAKYAAKAQELQKLLNLNGAHIMADGKAGKITSDAYFAVTGAYLNGDPRKI